MATKRTISSIYILGFLFLGSNLWASQGVPVLIYHEIVNNAEEKPLGETVVTLAQFEEQMRYLAEHGFTTISMQELMEFMQGKRDIPEKSVVITFDDGWRSQLNALPILEHYQFKASFWIITGNGYEDVYLNEGEIKKIDANPNWEVESHTVTHPWDIKNSLLTWLKGCPAGKNKEDVMRELVDSKAKLERILNRKITMLAWPCGWFNETLVHMAQDAGYEVLLTTISKMNYENTDILKICRFFVNGLYDIDDFKNIVEYGRLPF